MTSDLTSAAFRNLQDRRSPASHRSSLAQPVKHWHEGPWQEVSADAPHAQAFIELLEAFRATGGTAPGSAVARLLEEHQGGHAVSLAKRVFMRELFGFDWRCNFWIPMFQFRSDDLAVKVEPQRVRAALPSEWSGWTVACWFAAPLIQLEGRSPVDALDADFNGVLRAAKSCEAEPRSVPPRH
jgi:hypothetical protein